MIENKYDDETFFAKYSAFPRSVHGLKAAGEWHELKKLLPDFAENAYWTLAAASAGTVFTRPNTGQNRFSVSTFRKKC